MTSGGAFEALVHIMARLRGPNGCPWDREQNHESLKPYLIEEAYEVLEALDRGNDEEIRSELGDLLLQIVFHAQIAEEEQRFSIIEVIEAINSKMRRRHPHVFGDLQVSGSREVLRNWSKIKAEERRNDADRSALAGVPRAMPALLRAQRIGEKAAHVGFDWERAKDVLDKVHEELDEMERAFAAGNAKEATEELGDLLLAATSFARHMGANAEDLLQAAVERFSLRFRRMETDLASRSIDIHDATSKEKERLWETAKQRE